MTQLATAEALPQRLPEHPQDAVLSKVDGFKNIGEQLIAQAERAVIDSDESLAKGADLAKYAKLQLDKQEDARTALVKPLNDHVKFINAQFKPVTSAFEKAISTIKGKMSAYVEAREKRDRELMEAAKKAAEDMALDRAADLEAQGRAEEAKAVVAAAAELPEAAPKSAAVRGSLGGVGSFRDQWIFEIEDFSKVPDEYKEIATKAVNAAIKKGVREIPGLRIFSKKNVAIK